MKGRTASVDSTDLQGMSGSTTCDVLFPGRCDTTQPGTFCAVLNGTLGERMLVTVEDALGNFVTLDAGNMRDEITGAEVVGERGGIVTFPADERYSAIVPEGAFEEPTIVQITPITDAGIGIGLDLADFPVLTSFDQAKVELIGAVALDFEGTAQVNIDISVPAPSDADVADQYIATRVVNFRGSDEQTMVDEASFNPDSGLVVTGFVPGFPLIVTSGIFGVHKAEECLAFATGFVAIGDLFNAGYLPGGVPGALLPFPIVSTERVRFALPVPCNQSVQVEIRTFEEQPIDDVPCGPSPLVRAEVCELLGVLTDDTRPPGVQDVSVPDGGTDVDPLGPLTVTFDESMDPDSITDQTCQVTGSSGLVKGRCELSPDGRVLTFVPEIRLRFGETYTFTVDGITDLAGQAPAAPFSSTFDTFELVVLQHIDIDARDVVWIEPESVGLGPCDDLIAVAEGDALKLDFEGGIKIYDVTDLSEPPTLIASHPTSGVDRALTFAAAEPLQTTGQNGGSYVGPYIMSVDGPGDPDRFGVWRILDLSDLAAGNIAQVATRLINHSANSWRQLNLNDPQGALLGGQLELIPNDLGIPLDVAAFGTQVSYIANTPHIGIQAIVPQEMNADALVTPQVDGTVLGTYRGVSTLRDKVLALRQDGATNQLVMADAQLQDLLDVYPIPANARSNSVSGLANWPGRAAFDSQETMTLDLAIVAHSHGLAVVPVDTPANRFVPDLLPAAEGKIRTPGGTPQAAIGDRDSQLLYVADGTTGLTVIDLAVPTGDRDDDGDGIDDRVLGSVDLGGARAQEVVVWRDAFGRSIAAVASTGGVHIVAVGQGDVEPAPDVLRVNSNFDEGRLDIDSGYAESDAVTADLTAVSGPDAEHLIVNDLHSGFFGVRPGRLHAGCFTSCTLSKVPEVDPETGQPEQGELRVHAISALGSAAEEQWEVPLDVNLLPLLYDPTTATIPSGDDVTYWLEGVRAGPITVDFRCEAPATSATTFRQQFLVATHQDKQKWQEEIRQQVLLQEQLLHPQTDVVDLLDFQLPNGFMTNRPHIQGVYRFYESMFVAQPAILLWSGLSKLAGAPVYSGLSDSEWARSFSLGFASAEIDVFQGALMTVNLDIMSDMAWQYRAYLASGIWALRYVAEDEARGEVTMFRPTLVPLDLDPWEGLWSAETGLKGADIAFANRDLLQREQEFIAQPGWDIIGQESTLPLLPEWILSVLSESPVPDGEPFRQVVGAFADVTKFPQRWQWIDGPGGIWSGWLAMPPAARVVEAQRHLKDRAAEYSLVSTLACIPATDVCLAIQ